MNIVRKLRGAGSSLIGGESAADSAAPMSSSAQLGLMHLKKLFSEFTHPPHPLGEAEKDDKLYNMLPLFCKVFGSGPSSNMNEKFWDILSFCHQVSLLMVSEIRRRALNQSTEAASQAIAKFLEIENSEESSNGWMLLSTLNLLAAGDSSLVQVMAEVSVPSTLVKCLYLFFDLPEMPEEEANRTEANSEFTPKERRILLQKIFVQVLVRLCSHPVSAEELARKDDLSLLFLAITSTCSAHNVMWRKSASEVLMTLSRHGLTPPVVHYIHTKGCVSHCMDNMQKVPQPGPLEVVEMFVAVFCFLKDSSDVSPMLIDDFRACQGYLFLSDFLIKLDQERERNPDAHEALRNLVLMITSLCMCGYIELKPSQASVGSLFQLQGFCLPQPSGRGTSVRNIQAFQVLQSTFLKSNSTVLCSILLDSISSVYNSDSANFFILESQNTLSQFAERIHHKPGEIQRKLFQLLEYIVFQLNFVPCKELISLSILLKSHSQQHGELCVMCIRTLLAILRHNAIFKDVYREVGIIEVFVTCLRRYAEHLEAGGGAGDTPQDAIGALIVEALTYLLAGNVANANVLRECGGGRCVHTLIAYQASRQMALGIVRELILSSGGDDDMTNLLATLHSAPPTDSQLKTDILKSLLSCLRESHRTRTVFRKVSGFIYVTSVLVSLEGRLKDAAPDPDLMSLIQIVFHTISTAMRFEPANAKFFHNEICLTSLCDTLRLLGCFSKTHIPSLPAMECSLAEVEEVQGAFQNVFGGSVTNPVLTENVPAQLTYACLVVRLLYDLALDAFDKPNLASGALNSTSPMLSKQISNESQSVGSGNRSAVNSLNLNPPTPDPIIVHPGVVVAMLQLIPSITYNPKPELGIGLQVYVAEIIKSLVRSERNQQIMCDCGLVGQIVAMGSPALQDEQHPLHPPLQYMLERLAAQSLEPQDLRAFLRLGNPLCCLALGSEESGGGPVPLTRVKTLVSMTTPRDFRSQGSWSAMSPPFIEFDMSAEGFGCLYLPSIAPQAPGAVSVVSADNSVLGGIGSGDRLFPPQTGLSYSTWVCVDKFSDPRSDPHCVRLLTIVRSSPPGAGFKDDLICLSVVLSARDKAIIVSTQETLMPHNIGEWEPEGTGECGARVWCPDLLQEGRWHHLALVLNRAVLKNSSFSLYVDGQLVHSQRLHFVSQNPGGGSANLASTTQVYGLIGTPPAWRRFSKLCWKQGVCHLLEEVLTPITVGYIYQLGPLYMGSLQSVQMTDPDCVTALVPEEKVMFGLNAKAMSLLTLAKIRKVYSKVDNKNIAKQLGMSSHENATPIKVLHNSAGHLFGAARTLGGIVVGYLGVRVFAPRPVAVTIDTVGGCSILLGVIAMAQDVESLYAGVKALVCVVRSNKAAQGEMDRRKGYQTLAMLLKRKRHLLNSHILHLTFSLVGTVDSGRESSAIPNLAAFQDLLCDLEVWHEAPGELLRTLLEHMYELAAESCEKRTNLWVMRDLQIVVKLLQIVNSVKQPTTRHILFSLLSVLLGNQPRQSDLLYFGQFIAATLPASSTADEKALLLQEHPAEDASATAAAVGGSVGEAAEAVVLRNRCLQLLHSMLYTPRNNVSIMVCDEVARTLGFDWLLLFLQPGVHPATVVWALRILVVLCSVQALVNKFRDANGNGGWLRHTEMVSQNKMSLMLGCPSGGSHGSDIKAEALLIPGFQHLQWILPAHLDVPEVYLLTTALMMGQAVRQAPSGSKFDLDSVWSYLWGVSLNNTGQHGNTVAPRVNICLESAVILLTMARVLFNRDPAVMPDWLRNHSTSIVKVLFSLYHNMPDFVAVFMTAEVLSALAACLFPLSAAPATDSQESSGSNTPASEYEPDLLPHSPGAAVEDNHLTNHPAKGLVIDFIRVILVDSLSLSVTAKSTPVVDLVLDAYPEKCTTAQQISYQTEVLGTAMDHLLAADMLAGDQAAIPVVPLPNAHVQHVAPNVSYLAARIVDKLWQGSFSRDPHDVFDFIVKLIVQAKRRPGAVSLEGLHHCLNRTILYLLSRPTDTVAEQMSVLEALHKLTNHRLLVFGAGNHELDFIGCLTFCLLQLITDMKVMVEGNIKTTWHVNPSSNIESRDDQLNQHQGKNLMAGAALRVWEELYACKKPAIEEVFKVTLIPPSPNAKAPDLMMVRDQIYEAATKLWLSLVDAEKKAVYRVPWEIHNQIQSKIHKVTGGLTRLASRTKVRKEEVARVRVQVRRQQALLWTFNHISLVRELNEIRHQQHVHTVQHTQRYVHQEWLQTEAELTRERGLWGPTEPCSLDKWMLDTTEGPSRMRKKAMRNELFYLHYPYRPDYEKGALKYKVAISFHSKEYFLATQKHNRNFLNGLSDPDRLEAVAEESAPMPLVPLPSLTRLKSEPDDQQDDMDQEEEPSPPPDNQTLLRLLEEHEKISHMFRCARIQGLDTTEGLLLFGQEHCYVVDGFTLLKNRDIRDIESVPPESMEPIVPNPGSPRRSRAMRQCSKFSYEDIREVHKRRYLLQPMALEVFSGDGRNYLLAFPRKVRNKVYQRFMATATGIADSAQQSVAGQKRTANVEQATGLLSNLIGETTVTQRWVRGEISNFQYLMHLNTLAGRSYNDLMQYPVFPWILADYDSDELDLSDPATFRDFSRPMGAQSPDRLDQFRKRYKVCRSLLNKGLYEEWDDPHGETPPYHFGTHYSSAMIVCSYLVRMEPFTQHFLRLQGGHFDLADRMFNSIKEAWLSASKHNMADVKELIPEFFYLQEFLLNSNKFDLGSKQSGVALGDVVLPPWAKQDPREFIRMHRLALECDFVSQHLHQWIDLIFGFKQQGQAAVESVNVFHHLFYEGNVDIDNIDDPLKKTATIGFINNFGQIPKQLFRKPHPCKKMNSGGGSRTSMMIDPNVLVQALVLPPPEKLFYHHLDNLKPSLQPIKEVKGPVGQILHLDKVVLAVEQNKVLMPPVYNRYVAWGFADHSLRVGNYDSEKAVFVCESVVQNSGEIVACVCPNPRLIVLAGTSSVVTVWEYDMRKKDFSIRHSLYAHTDAVTCLAASTAYNVIISGSRDCSAVVWDLSRRLFVRQLRGHSAPIAAVAINDLTGDVATCAGTWLHVWSINGDPVAEVNTCVGNRADRMQQILCVAFSQVREWDSANVIMTGSTDGVVRMWSVDYIQAPLDEDQLQHSSKPSETVSKPGAIHSRLIKQINVSTDSSGTNLVKSGSESSLSEDSSVRKASVQLKTLDISSKEWQREQQNEKDTCSDTEDNSAASGGGGGRRRSRTQNKFKKESSKDGSLDVSSAEDSSGGLRTSKSDTSLTESFVMVPDPRKRPTNPLNVLRPGFKWLRQLVFRSKLTMHTAYDRKDNAEPASVTALAVSRDHRTVYVGDARGRVFSWSVCENPGKPADHWTRDESADHCAGCSVRFTIYERKHHCRNCGQVFCSRCSRFESEISRLRILKPVRVCQKCYAHLRGSDNP